jgi:hypothetical protein
MLAESRLLVGPLMPDRSKGRGETKCRLWSSRLGFGRGDISHTGEAMEMNHGGD